MLGWQRGGEIDFVKSFRICSYLDSLLSLLVTGNYTPSEKRGRERDPA
jgi:hypothetical protein